MGNQLGGAVPAEVRQSEVGAALDRLQRISSNLSDEANYFVERVNSVLTTASANTATATDKEAPAGCLLAEIITAQARALEAVYEKLYNARQRVEL